MSDLDRTYAVLTVKALEDTGAARTLTGIASTPTPDRHGDIIEPLGATFSNPVPLLLHHDKQRPVGWAILTATPTGIAFTATLAAVAKLAPGAVRDRINETWDSLQAGLIRGASIGFRPLVDGVKMLKSGGLHLLKIDIAELSLVTVPANVEATIHTIKSFDAPHLAASGLTPPGVSGLPARHHAMNPTPAEHIQNLENKRAATMAAMTTILESTAGEGVTLAEEQAAEHDKLAAQVKSLDADLLRWRDLERLNMTKAAPVTGALPGAPNYRPHVVPQISVRPNVLPGTAFVRYTLAMLNAKGDSYRALEYAKQWKDQTPEVELMIKAAVAPGTTTDPAWAGALVQVNNLTNEFIELSRPATILGKIPGLTRVPFNVSVPIQTGGGTYKWVGQAKAKPVGKLQFASASLGMAKAAGIIVLTEELIRTSSPAAEGIVRNDMVKGIAQFLDQQFTDPAVAEVANVSPASITNGAGTAASTNDPGLDIGAIVSYFAANGVPLEGLTLIMSQTNAFAMGYQKNAFGTSNYPGVGAGGGAANGMNIVASNAVGDLVIGLAPDRILYADDGGVNIDVSREATLQMNDTPTNPGTEWTSLWQDNLVGLRAERFINWKRAQQHAVYYLTAAAYPFTAPPIVVGPIAPA